MVSPKQLEVSREGLAVKAVSEDIREASDYTERPPPSTVFATAGASRALVGAAA